MNPIKIPVDEFTTPSPVTVSPSVPLPTVQTIMAENGFRHVPVVERDHAVGIISERDVKLVASLQGSAELHARDVMVERPYCVESGSSLEQVALEMSRKKIGSAIVNDGGRIVGIFTSTDALNALVEVLRGDVP